MIVCKPVDLKVGEAPVTISTVTSQKLIRERIKDMGGCAPMKERAGRLRESWVVLQLQHDLAPTLNPFIFYFIFFIPNNYSLKLSCVFW